MSRQNSHGVNAPRPHTHYVLPSEIDQQHQQQQQWTQSNWDGIADAGPRRHTLPPDISASDYFVASDLPLPDHLTLDDDADEHRSLKHDEEEEYEKAPSDALEELADEAGATGVEPTCRDVQEEVLSVVGVDGWVELEGRAQHDQSAKQISERAERGMRAINTSHPFGLRIWKPALYRKFRSIDARTDADLHSTPGARPFLPLFLNPGNLLWLILFGWWLCCLYVVVAVGILAPFWGVGVLVEGVTGRGGSVRAVGEYVKTEMGLEYGEFLWFGIWGSCFVRDDVACEELCFRGFGDLAFLELGMESGAVLLNLSTYVLWPFGKFVARRRPTPTTLFQQPNSTTSEEPNERTALLSPYHDQGESSDNDDVPGIDNERTPRARAFPNTLRSEDVMVPMGDGDGDAEGEVGQQQQQQRPQQRSGRRISDAASIYTDDMWSEYSFTPPPNSSNPTHPTSPYLPSWMPRHIANIIRSGFAGILFAVVTLLFIAPLQILVAGICFLCIFPLPMAKLNWVLLKHLVHHPLQIWSETPNWRVRPVEERLTPGEMFFGPRPDRFTNSNNTTNGTANAAQPPRPKSTRQTSQYGPSGVGVFEPVVIPATLGHPTHPPPDLHITISNPTNAYPTPRTLPQPPSRLPSTDAPPPYYIVLCTYHAMGLGYYKYTIDGVNIILFNLLFVTFFCLFDFYVLKPLFPSAFITSTGVIFTLSLLATVPLAYFIGMGVAAITTSTGNLALGAVINATFGSIIEILLYCLALLEGKWKIVEGAIIGSLLCGLLALPGISMFAGGVRYKEQKFNAKSAGVTSTLLVLAVGGMIAPTVFQEIYGSKRILCQSCPSSLSCNHCQVVNTPEEEDTVYWSKTRWVMYLCAASLVIIYVIGMVFMLRTHRGRIYGHGDRSSVVGDVAGVAGRRKKGRSGLRVVTGGGGERGLGSSGPVSASEAPWGVSSVHSVGSYTGAGTPVDGARPTSYAREVPHMSPYVPPRMERVSSAYSTVGNVNVRESPLLRPRSEFIPLTADTDADDPATTLRRRNPHTRPQTIHDLPPHPLSAPPPISRTTTARPTSSAVDAPHTASGGHDSPNWSLPKSFFVLFACTVLYSLVAEVLIDSVDVVLEGGGGGVESEGGGGVGEKFLGVTIVAVVPTVTEFYNAIAFSINDNIALSLEIGSAYAMQVALLQIPVMVGFSVWTGLGGGGLVSAPRDGGDVGMGTFTVVEWDKVGSVEGVALAEG
ncbi:hypothetical protein HDV00_007458 [Rhizophlyctis rosea]|nr:hypothetical protein HDV00_007458 [Rhizophlyctis rosea]